MPRVIKPIAIVQHIEKVAREYVRKLQDHIGPHKDVPAPDVNTNAMVMDWMVDEFEKLTGDTNKASFTGKSIEKGGSVDVVNCRVGCVDVVLSDLVCGLSIGDEI